jgi:hypothetical protein
MIAAYKLRRTEYILAHSSLVVIASNNWGAIVVVVGKVCGFVNISDLILFWANSGQLKGLIVYCERLK